MSKRAVLKTIAVTPLLGVLLLACAHLGMTGAKPPESEFGYGPRNTAAGLYRVTIEETLPFRVGKLLTTAVKVETVSGQAVEQALIEVDGGMPQHGHGLPTRPRMSRELGQGRYEVAGLKFNMGGWWELKFTVRAGTAADSVTFNLSL